MKVIYKNKIYQFISYHGLNYVTATRQGKFYTFLLDDVQMEW